MLRQNLPRCTFAAFICRTCWLIYVQQCRAQIHRAGSHRNQPESTTKPQRILQEEKIPPPWFAAEKNSCYSAAVDKSELSPLIVNPLLHLSGSTRGLSRHSSNIRRIFIFPRGSTLSKHEQSEGNHVGWIPLDIYCPCFPMPYAMSHIALYSLLSTSSVWHHEIPNDVFFFHQYSGLRVLWFFGASGSPRNLFQVAIRNDLKTYPTKS